MQYHYLRVFALADERFPLLDLADGASRPTRSQYLERVFSERIDFIHRKAQLVYIPIGREDREGYPVMLGRVGRSFQELVNEPPEQGFAETELTTWRASNILIDTGEHTDGQKIAMQVRGDVGNPLAVLTSLVRHLNEVNEEVGWILEISPMTEPGNFWSVVRQYKGEITSAVFTFVTPNVLGLRSKLNADLKAARQDNNAHRVTVMLANEKGNLELEQQNIKDALDYISEGGGTAKLKRGRKTIYDSEKDEKTVDLEDDEPIMAQRKSRWSDFVKRLFG